MVCFISVVVVRRHLCRPFSQRISHAFTRGRAVRTGRTIENSSLNAASASIGEREKIHHRRGGNKEKRLHQVHAVLLQSRPALDTSRTRPTRQ